MFSTSYVEPVKIPWNSKFHAISSNKVYVILVLGLILRVLRLEKLIDFMVWNRGTISTNFLYRKNIYVKYIPYIYVLLVVLMFHGSTLQKLRTIMLHISGFFVVIRQLCEHNHTF